MLELEDVQAYYGLSHVLQGITLSVGVGEVVVLCGRNGVGKTTAIKTIAGWVKAASGSIRLNGVGLEGLSSDRICRMGIGLVPEDRRIFPGLTVEENLKLGLLQCPWRPTRESRLMIEQAYERFPRLKERRFQMGTALSGGEQQMLAIARVLIGAPKLLLIDEPTEGLAPIIVDEIFAIIASLRDEGIPILLVEQNVHRALDVATRFYALERGQIVMQGDASSTFDRVSLDEVIAV
ncbi:ABC transporter ATP-binding protein [Eoetvoesiella caeni]|uniref:Amino acid/amide ABC transporter ATP-binding protein 2 (HAAT family) n=1 Tax=Eoetvoesiella caeni TaxID=645616 RepID=A0A366HIH7_9BURK|nr:ABC transporter ATP-binding protein [Eoetvoesiella caeni]MCI2808031.1 ABC transporter ATP-binding protein [Eoetvoesiella caeni]NYT53966.1 ABC transporter ATP-binding protein [Eoetvoesiella caeni]RBP41951.1 amino acid/amide ABC transporter ATP-binding protein 2 (HAAT family) [Eoetvoesiella caeni]